MFHNTNIDDNSKTQTNEYKSRRRERAETENSLPLDSIEQLKKRMKGRSIPSSSRRSSHSASIFCRNLCRSMTQSIRSLLRSIVLHIQTAYCCKSKPLDCLYTFIDARHQLMYFSIQFLCLSIYLFRRKFIIEFIASRDPPSLADKRFGRFVSSARIESTVKTKYY